MRGAILITLLVLAMTAQGAGIVREGLLGYEWQANTMDWRATQIPDLVRISQDETELMFIRNRAIAVLGHLGDTTSMEALLGLLGSLGTSEAGIGLKRRIVDELCSQPVTRNPDVQQSLISVLASANQHLRYRAAVCLKSFPSNEAVSEALDSYYLNAAVWELQGLSKD